MPKKKSQEQSENPEQSPNQKKKIKLNELYEYKPDLAFAKAYQDYMNYHSPREICARYGIPYSAFSVRAHGRTNKLSWKRERDLLEDKALGELMKEKRQDLSKIFGLTSKLILRSLARFDHGEAPATVEEASKLSQILVNCDKVWRLQQELPTDIISTKELTVDEMKDIVREINELDPFMDYKIDDKEDGPVTH